MALGQLTTPTIKPPTSLDMLDEEDGAPKATGLAAPATTTMQSLAAPQTTGVGGLTPPGTSTLPGPNVSEFAQQQMNNPSRWNLDMVRQGVDLINQEMDESGKRGTANLDEFFSSRGLVGSSPETQGRTDFLSQLERTKSQRMFDLSREMANTYATDVANAGQLGLGARAQELQAMGMNADDAYRYAVLEQSGSQFQQELGQRQTEFGGTLGLGQQDLDLRAQEIQQRAQLEGRALSIEEARQQAQAEQFNQSLSQRESEFARQFGLSGQDLQLRAQELQQQAQLEGRSLDIQEATAEAELDLRSQQLVQEAELQGRALSVDEARQQAENQRFFAGLSQEQNQFMASLQQRAQESAQQFGLSEQELTLRAQELTQRAHAENRSLSIEEARAQVEKEQFEKTLLFQREQFAQQMGLSQDELDLQREDMVRKYQDTQAERLNRMALQSGDQSFQRTENALNRSLEQQALALQQSGLDAETAWREADRLLERELENRALTLQQQGLTYDQAYRQSALQLDREQMQQAGQVANQQAQLSAADIYLRALAAGAGDMGPVDYPNIGLIGGGTTAPGGGGGTTTGPTVDDTYIRSIIEQYLREHPQNPPQPQF